MLNFSEWHTEIRIKENVNNDLLSTEKNVILELKDIFLVKDQPKS